MNFRIILSLTALLVLVGCWQFAAHRVGEKVAGEAFEETGLKAKGKPTLVCQVDGTACSYPSQMLRERMQLVEVCDRPNEYNNECWYYDETPHD